MPNYILYLEEHGFQVSEYSSNLFVKCNVKFHYQAPSKIYSSIMYRDRCFHKLKLCFNTNFILNYELIGFFFDFLEHAYNESKKYRKERTMEDVDLDTRIFLNAGENRYCFAKILVEPTILSYFIFFDIQRLEYNVIYKEHRLYNQAVDFNNSMLIKHSKPENNYSDLL
jgi:hypothetical protein